MRAEVTSWTALRGLAALWIVFHHFWPQTSFNVPLIVAKGYLAVDLFFVLSGAVLFRVYAAEIRTGSFSAWEFAVKRFARLYPVHFVTMLIAVAVLTLGPALGAQARALPYDLSQMIVLQASLLHAWGFTPTGGLNYPSWSLSAEAFAYLLFPALCIAVLRFSPKATLTVAFAALIACAIAFEMFWPSFLRKPADAFVFTRLENDFGALRIVPEFLLGLTIGHTARLTLRGGAVTLSSVAAMAIALWLNQDLLFVLGGAGLILGLMHWNPANPRALLWLGRISYSLYMVHALVQIVGFKLIESLGGWQDGAVPPIWIAPLLGLSLVVASLMNKLIEQPARQWIVGRGIRTNVTSNPQSYGPAR